MENLYDALGDMQLSDKLLPMLTVYDNPSDFPGKIVLRRSDVLMGKGEVRPWKARAVFDTLLAARHAIRRNYPHLTALPRQSADDPVIVEVWL